MHPLQPPSSPPPQVDCFVRGDLGQERMACVTTTGGRRSRKERREGATAAGGREDGDTYIHPPGMLSVWDKTTISLLHRHQYGGGGLQGVVVLSDLVLVAASDYLLLLDADYQVPGVPPPPLHPPGVSQAAPVRQRRHPVLRQ